jgi:hypothetical protein
MHTLRRCSALALLSLLACAEDHEGRSTKPAPQQAAGTTRSGDTEEAPGNPAAQGDDEPPMRKPPNTTPEPDSTDEDVPPATTPPATTPPATTSPATTPPAAWTPVLDSFPGRLTGVPDICAKRTFNSLSLGDIQSPSPCSYRMPNWGRIVDPKFVRVIVGGSTRPLGLAANGWVVAEDGYSVTLLGTACEAALAGTEISITSECAPTPQI